MSQGKTHYWEEGGVWYYEDGGITGSGVSYCNSIEDWAKNVRKSLGIQLTENDMTLIIIEDIKRRNEQNM